MKYLSFFTIVAVSGFTLADDPLPASQFPLLVQDGPIFFGVRPDSFVEPNPAQFVFTQKAKVAPVAGVPLTPVGPVPAVVPAPLVGPVPSVAPVPAPGPIFVPAPVVVATAPAPRPTGTFVFFGRPTAAPATTAAPTVTTAAPITTTAAPATTTEAPSTTAPPPPPPPPPTTAAPSTTAAPPSSPPPAPVLPSYGVPALRPSYVVPAEDNGPVNYVYEYGVTDALSGVNLGHKEGRDGYLAQGQYFVSLPDGRLQTVTYHADANGYVADVQYQGQAAFPVVVKPTYAP